MSNFIKLILSFCGITILTMLLFLITLYFISTPKSYNKDNAIFIWGDSQTYQGIDISQLSDKTGYDIYSSAVHGAGVYDFIVFTELVPDSSICIIGYSQCCLLRKKESDYNRSGVNYPAIEILNENKYGLSEIITILQNNNFLQKDIFKKKSTLYPYCDTIITPEPIEGFRKMYAYEPVFYNDKYNIYKKGIKKLIDKECKIIIIAFPYYNEVANFYKSSGYRQHIDKDIYLLATEYSNNKIDTFYINDSDSLLMHDLTHFNEIGAKRASNILSQYIDSTILKPDGCRFVILNDWSCN